MNTERTLPVDDPQRLALHNELHARPPARIRIPSLMLYVAVLNDGVSREAECAHLRRLPGQQALDLADLEPNFLRLRLPGLTVKWERHTEFSRYSVVLPLPEGAGLGACEPDLATALEVDAYWLHDIPGATIAAIQLVFLPGNLSDPTKTLDQARHWFGDHAVVASRMGASQLGGGHSATGHSCVVTDFKLRPDGFERMLVIAANDWSDTRAGRIAQRLLEIENYRLLALRGLPAAKGLGTMLTDSERTLAEITARLESHQNPQQQHELLSRLISLAARVELATAQCGYRFAATQAYSSLVDQRITELREIAIPGTQSLGEFMRRRLSPAMATVAATERRLASLSQRIGRASALLRTRVDIAAEAQNQELLSKLTRGKSCNCGCSPWSKACRLPPSPTTWSA